MSAAKEKRHVRVAIVGARDFIDKSHFEDLMIEALKETRLEENDIQEVVSGGAEGTDTLAREWAEARRILITEKLPQFKKRSDTLWKKKLVYLDRNTEIVDASDVVIAFPSSKSRGTWDTVNKARKAKKTVCVLKCD